MPIVYSMHFTLCVCVCENNFSASESDFQFLKTKQLQHNHNKISSKTKTIINLQKIQQTPPFRFPGAILVLKIHQHQNSTKQYPTIQQSRQFLNKNLLEHFLHPILYLKKVYSIFLPLFQKKMYECFCG